MRYLISINTIRIPANNKTEKEWNVNHILVWGSDIDNKLRWLPSDEEKIVIFIPAVLSYENSLSYDGANIAIRILMHYIQLNRANDIDVVLLGNESLEAFLLHYEYPNILKVPGMHYIWFNKNIVAYYSPQRPKYNTEEYEPFLNNIGFRLPSSFRSTHSLTNEWCLFKWSHFMGYDTNAFVEKLNGTIFFEYLITIHKIRQIRDQRISDNLENRISQLETNTRILLIDDNPQWHIFFKHFFKDNSTITFDCIGTGYNKLTLDEIKTNIQDKIEAFNPKIILLDFRLMEDRDTEITDFSNISGAVVLKDILKGSIDKPSSFYGCQTIIFTATSRIENILKLRRLGADDFILKEKAELYTGKEITKDAITGMIKSIEHAIDRANFLIPLSTSLDKIAELIRLNPNIEDSSLKNNTALISKSVRQITQHNELTLDILKQLYLNLFNIFEEIKRNSEFVIYPNNFSLTIKANQALEVCRYNVSGIWRKSADNWDCIPKFNMGAAHHQLCNNKDLNFAICALILFRLGYTRVDDTKWNDIRKLRNKIAHGDNELLKFDCHTLQKNILHMLELIIKILDSTQIKEVIPQLSN